MTLLRLSPLALSRSRFALSPLAETVGVTIRLGLARTEPWRPARSDDRQLTRDPFLRGLAGLLSHTKWLPDVVVLPPTGGMGTSFASELEPIRAMTDAEIRAGCEVSVQHSWIHQDLRWLGTSALGDKVASALETVWSQYVASDWPRRRTALEREVMYRAGLLAAFGWPAALEGMSRRSRWVGADSIRFSDRPAPDKHVGENGLQFVPVTMPNGTWLCERGNEYALVYPAGRAAAGTPTSGRIALERLIGRGRAELLDRLSRPATTSELATELGLSLGTVGRHLKILRDAGLVVGFRNGHKLIYHLTGRGAGLIADDPARRDAGKDTDSSVAV